MRFAPDAFRSTRVKTTDYVKAALRATHDLLSIDCATLRANPSSLPTLRMCTAPPLAVDRLVGLSGASKSLIGSMEEGRLAARMKAELLDENLNKVCAVLSKLLDHDIFPWLESRKAPTDRERDRASTIVADRLCSAVANPIIRNAQEQRQLTLIGEWLDRRSYRKQIHAAGKPLSEMDAGTYWFRMNLAVGKAVKVNIPIDVVIHRRSRGRTACQSSSKPSPRATSPTRTNAVRKRRPRYINFRRRMARTCVSCCSCVGISAPIISAMRLRKGLTGCGSIASTIWRS